MPLSTYGLLKGTIVGHLRDADDDHYQILVQAGKTLHRIAVNVRSSAPNAPSTVLFASSTSLPADYTGLLQAAKTGYTRLASKPGGIALDFVRSGMVKTKTMKPLPPDQPGVDNDLKDLLETAVVKAMGQAGAVVYALGAKWGPEEGKADKYFKFAPGNGIHDIHMNQGNSGKYKKDNGVYQDGAIYIGYPGGTWRAIYLAFQSQVFETDGSGNPASPAGASVAGAAQPAAKKSPGKPAVKSKPAGKSKPRTQPKAKAKAKGKAKAKTKARHG